MARARNLKPGFFKNELLANINPLGRILFSGLWCLADREGRLEDRPARIKAELLPYDQCEVEELLKHLDIMNFIKRYKVGGQRYIQIVNFKRHQNPHKKEPKSEIPPMPNQSKSSTEAQEKPGNYRASSGNSGTSPASSLIPHSLIPLSPSPLSDSSLKTTDMATAQGGDHPPSGKPPKKAKETVPAPEGYKAFVDHAFVTYRAKFGGPPHFGKAEGNTVKALLVNYPVHLLKALWDVFLAKNWDWREKGTEKLVKVGHSVLVFQTKITIMMESGEWKAKAREYEGATDPGVQSLMGGLAEKLSIKEPEKCSKS